MAASVNVGASGPFGSPEAFLSGENIDLPTSNPGQQPTPAHSLATSPYNPYEDDESDAITPITNNKIRLGAGGLGVGELSHGIQVPIHALNMPIIDEQGAASMDSPPAESVVSAKLTSDGLSPPVLDSASVTSKSFVEDDISRNSGSIGGGGGGIRPRRGRVRSLDHARAAGNNDVFMTGPQQPHLDDVPEESSFGVVPRPFGEVAMVSLPWHLGVLPSSTCWRRWKWWNGSKYSQSTSPSTASTAPASAPWASCWNSSI